MAEELVLEFTNPPELVMETDKPINLSDDTVSDSTVLSGVRFHRPDGQVAYGTCNYDCNTSGGTAVAKDIMDGKVAYSHGQEIVGTHVISIKITGGWRDSKEHTVQSGTYTGSPTLFTVSADELAKQGEGIFIPSDLNLSIGAVSGTMANYFNPNNLFVQKVTSGGKVTGIKVILGSSITIPRDVSGTVRVNIAGLFYSAT